MNGYVYILKSLRNNSFYVGCTKDLKRRLEEHNQGRSTYTKKLLPLKLVFSQEFNWNLCRKVEYKLKRLKSRIILE
jgi:putative endonuclease